MSWVGDPGRLKSSIFVTLCLGKKAGWGNQSLGSPPQVTEVLRQGIIPLCTKDARGGPGNLKALCPIFIRSLNI